MASSFQLPREQENEHYPLECGYVAENQQLLRKHRRYREHSVRKIGHGVVSLQFKEIPQSVMSSLAGRALRVEDGNQSNP